MGLNAGEMGYMYKYNEIAWNEVGLAVLHVFQDVVGLYGEMSCGMRRWITWRVR